MLNSFHFSNCFASFFVAVIILCSNFSDLFLIQSDVYFEWLKLFFEMNVGIR